MTHPRTTPQAAKPGLSRLRPVVSCGVRAAALLAFACFAALLVPVCVDVNSGDFNVYKSQAFADGEEPPLPEGAKELAFIDLMANESGLNSGDFVATSVGVLTAVTGMQFAANPGIKLADATLGDNLDYLIDAADYPAWDSLTELEQARYGNQQNYNASKYMSLMNAYGIDEDFQRYEESVSSGGGHFLFSDETADRLGRIGKVGENWKNNIGVAFGELQSLVQDLTYVKKYFGKEADTTGIYFDAEGIDGWPESVAKNVLLNYGTTHNYFTQQGTSNTYKAYGTIATSNPAYLVMFMNADGVGSNGYWAGYLAAFSDSEFNFGRTTNRNEYPNPNLSTTAGVVNYQGKSYYRVMQSGSILTRYPGGTFESSFVYNVIDYSSGTPNFNDIEKAVNIMATHSDNVVQEGGELEPDIPEYPTGEVPQTTDIYYPPQGLNPSNTWNNFTTVQTPANPFNPGDQTAKPEWKQETKQNIQGLQGIRFDKLFPFCLYYDLQKFWQKVQSICGIQTSENGTITTQASSVYDEIELRFYIPDVMDDTWTFDLEPLRNILLIVKPFMLVFLIGVEIISLIMLWKGILTGQ